MNKAHIDYLKTEYADIVGDYCQLFCQKHGFDYCPDEWVGGDVGGVLQVNDDYFFNFDDMRYDIDNDVEKGVFMEWYEYSVEVEFVEGTRNVNYRSWCMGYRPYTADQLKAMRDAQIRINELQMELAEIADNYNKDF